MAIFYKAEVCLFKTYFCYSVRILQICMKSENKGELKLISLGVFICLYNFKQEQKGYEELRKLCRQGNEFCREVSSIFNER